MNEENVTPDAPSKAPDTSTPVAEPLPSVMSTGHDDLDARLAAAAAQIGDDDDEPLPELPKPAGKKPAAKVEAKVDGAEDGVEKKPRNMMRDLSAEWATARRAQRENAKRAQELEARAQQIEEQRKEAEEISLYMQGHPIKAVERLAAKAGMRPSEYLQKLQMAYLNGEEDKPTAQQDSVAQELAALRAELYAEKQRRVEEEQAAHYQQQVETITRQETETLVHLAKNYGDNFPALALLDDNALKARVADAVQFFVSQGHEVGRFEVLQAVDNVVKTTLADYGLFDNLRLRAGSAPAAQAEKTSNATRGVKPRNGSSRHIPTNAAAANYGGVARALSHEERLAEAAKVLFSGQ